MPPRITRVRWGAANIPWGMAFDEYTGIFSGRPEVAGEYTVPVTVETNYGKDTKDVKIIVATPTPALPTYGVWAAGSRAVTWSEGAEPDEHGFYRLNAPEMQKLVAHYNGFGALSADYKYYFCGCYGLYRTASGAKEKTSYLAERNIPCCLTEIYADESETNKKILSGVDKTITLFYLNDYSEGNYKVRDSSHVIIFWNSTLAQYVAYYPYVYRIRTNKMYSSDTIRTYVSVPSSVYRIEGVTPENGAAAFDESPYAECSDGVHYLADKRRNTVKKVFQFPKYFTYLSADGYLDGNPNNFTHGSIKDAWVCSGTSCVQNEDRQLYQYASATKSWDLLGTYDMRKIEISPDGHIFILTDDGELYHKGKSITGLFDKVHDTLTHVYPSLTFKDFTFGANTLTVLRE